MHNNTHSAILEIDALGEKIPVPTIEELRSEGKKFSKYLDPKALVVPDGPPKANLTAFQHEIKPLLEASCVKCHGPDKQKGKFRVDTLDPDMINGEDGAWWVEVTDTISQGEMPPPDEEDVELADADRAKVVDWISQELLVASQSRRSEQGHTSFRRLTRYETSYALQDLLGLPYDFARDLPPETESEDGFQNSSEMLQMTSAQFETYWEIAHTALSKATVRGEQPEPVRYVITGESAEANFQKSSLGSIEKLRKKPDADSQAKLAEQEKVAWTYDANKAHFVNLETGRGFPSRSGYGRNSFRPVEELPETPEVSNYVLALPGNTKQLLDFGDFLPPSGTLLLRVRARNPLPIRPRTLTCESTSVTSPVTIPKPHSASVNGRSPLRQTARSSTKWTSTSAKFRATPFVVNIRWASDRTLRIPGFSKPVFQWHSHRLHRGHRPTTISGRRSRISECLLREWIRNPTLEKFSMNSCAELGDVLRPNWKWIRS